MSNSSSDFEFEGLYLDTASGRSLRALLVEESPIHAALLFGSSGSGQEVLAGWLARAWLCKSPVDGSPCEDCPACGAFGRGAAPDLLRVESRGLGNRIRVRAITPKRGEDDDDVLPVQEFLRTPPLNAKHKVVWIAGAEKMMREAFNAFLKTLEEPEPYSRFILTTWNPRLIPETILSRCLAVACELPSRAAVEGLLGPISEWERALGGLEPDRLRLLRKAPDEFERLFGLAKEVSTHPSGEALRAAEDFRRICESLADALDVPARTANLEAIGSLAKALSAVGASPGAVLGAVEAHRRIAGNGAMPQVVDALFAQISLGQAVSMARPL